MLTIHKASAGSGKTYNLAIQYVTLLLGIENQDASDSDAQKYILNIDDPLTGRRRIAKHHRPILAITFTNKATDEMKRRIIGELDKLSRIDASDSTNSFASALRTTFACTNEQLREAARLALNDLLLDYSFFNVSTIDSFSQSVLRQFAREIDRQGDYEIEIDERYAIAESMATMLDNFNLNPDAPASKPVRDWLRDYMNDATLRGKQPNVFNRKSSLLADLIDFVRTLFDERFNRYSKDLMEWLANAHKMTTFKHAISQYLNNVDSAFVERASEIDQIIKSCSELKLKKPYIGILERAISGEEQVLDKFSETYIRTINVDADVFSVDSIFNKLKKGSASDILGNRSSLLHEFFLDVTRSSYERSVVKAIAENINTIDLLRIILSYLNTLCRENNIMLLADTNSLLDKIIGSEEFPFIYERLGVNLRNFLIDEFQDTSRMQWHNLKPLLGASLADQHDSLIIGDVKQAIYRFRNSDSSMLSSSVENIDFPSYSEIRGNRTEENTNWRSAPNIVRFNNTLFSILASNLNIPGYEGVVQQISPKTANLEGYVRFFPVSDNDSNTSDLSDTISPRFSADISDKDQTALASMYDEISRQHNAGYPWSSIAILVSTNIQTGKVVDFLLLNNIPVLSDEGLLLRNASSVRTIIALMTLIERSNRAEKPTPQGSPKRASIDEIEIMMCRFDYFMHQYNDINRALALALDPKAQVNHDTKLQQQLSSLSTDKLIADIVEQNPATLSALVEIIIAKRLNSTVCTDEAAFIASFIDLITEYSTRFGNSPHAFLRYWNSKCGKAAVSSPPTADSVSVMTIHKSKGLEFDCVHIPFGSWSVNGKEEEIWIDAPQINGIPNDIFPPAIRIKTSSKLISPFSPVSNDIETNLKARRADILNKTYVAYTRAVRELCVYYDPKNDFGKLIQAAFELGLCPSQTNEIDPHLIVNFPISLCSDDNGLIIGKPTTPLSACVTEKDNSSIQTNYCDHLSIGKLAPTYRLHDEGLMRKLLCVDIIGDDTGNDLDTDPDVSDYVPEHHDNPDARLRGNALHYALSFILKNPNREDLDMAFVRTAQRYKLCDELISEYRKDIENALANTAIINYTHRWFEEPEFVRNEASIFIPSKNALDIFDQGQVRRIDRLMFFPDGSIEIVDYKFTSEASTENIAQVNEYIELISTAYPEAKVSGFLWYVDRAQIIPLSLQTSSN